MRYSFFMQKDGKWRKMIVRLLQERMLSQQELAAMCGVAQQTVSAWVAGKSAPGYFARRNLLALEKGPAKTPAQNANHLPSATTPMELADAEQAASVLKELLAVAEGMPLEALQELLQFAQFKNRQGAGATKPHGQQKYPTGARRKGSGGTAGDGLASASK